MDLGNLRDKFPGGIEVNKVQTNIVAFLYYYND